MLYAKGLKRAVDLVFSLLAFLLLAPLFVVLSISILLEDGRPIIFKQTRIGRTGRPFTILKFRSMPLESPRVQSIEGRDLRITRVGRLLRRTNFDELPQLLNIIRGEMGLVGPRPALPEQNDLLRLRKANGSLSCRPGLTGLAQVNAYDGMTFEEKARFDGEYVASIDLSNDVFIVTRTISFLFKPPPIY